jgi:phosphoenolpyruvate carboxykinase (GTP)
VTESFDWQHGVFLASNVASEGTAAAENKVGELRRDPFAMLPFCGYNMGDYFGHWLQTGAKADASKLPRIYYVNWFRKDADGKIIWPGFGDNSRVLKWIVERLTGKAEATETPIGLVPTKESLDLSGLDLTDEQLELLLSVDAEAWKGEAEQIKPHYERFGDHLPKPLWDQLEQLEQRLS